jgi:CHAD domain-containing protein
MAKGIRRVYRRGRRGLKHVEESPTDENLHEWRKRVKYLWYHARILEATWPAMMGTLVSELDALGDLLGEDHDLADVRALLTRKPEAAGSPSEYELMLGLVSRRQEELRTAALPRGDRIYAEKPAAFVARLGAYWTFAQSSAAG